MKLLREKLIAHFETFKQEGFIAFETMDATQKDELYELYLSSFRPEDNKVFRERREYDCSACRQFIRNIGGIVFIKDNQLPLQVVSIWDVDMAGTVFEPVVAALSAFVKSLPIRGIYLNDSRKVGVEQNFEHLESGNTFVWDHLALELPTHMVHKSNSVSIDSAKAEITAIQHVFKRSLDELSTNSVETVLELTQQNSLYKGEEWVPVLKKFRTHKADYDLLSDQEKDLYAWANAPHVGPVLGKIRNTSMGVLLTDISNNVDLSQAVKSYETLVAPSNYKRPKPIISKRMIEQAKATIAELGLESALHRRFATAEDIHIEDIAYVDRTIQSSMIHADNQNPFDNLMATVPLAPKAFDQAQEISIEKFMSDVLPTLTGLEVLVENTHLKNFVSLIAPIHSDVQPLFKWDNNFSWAYVGNMTDSDIRQNVKNAGGNIDGVLRFSLQWNDGDTHETDDLDAHCFETCHTRGDHIYYGNKRSRLTGGTLDVDIMEPKKGVPAVENIVWSTHQDVQTGEYQFSVINYARRSGTKGFSAELEVDGVVYALTYDKPLRSGEKVDVATVTYDAATQQFKTKIHIENKQKTQELWSIQTNQFVPVSLVTLSPNYWGSEKGVGNRHYMFMLEGCINNDTPYGFYNEYLVSDLVEHRRVFEALGEQLKVQTSENQLSGLGFSSTQPNKLTVKATGKTERVLTIKF